MSELCVIIQFGKSPRPPTRDKLNTLIHNRTIKWDAVTIKL
jgi:hypothetical protein